MSCKWSVKDFHTGAWFLRRNFTQLEASVPSDLRQLLLEDFITFLSGVVPFFSLQLDAVGAYPGYRGSSAVPGGGGAPERDICLVMNGAFVSNESHAGQQEPDTVPFSLQTTSRFSHYDIDQNTMYYKYSNQCISSLNELIFSCTFMELVRNPVIDVVNLNVYLERFSLESILARWSRIPTIDESVRIEIKGNMIRIVHGSDNSLSGDKKVLRNSIFHIIDKSDYPEVKSE